MRLLGKCPNCRTEDLIMSSEDVYDTREWRKVTCGQCNQRWDSWIDLVFAEERKGNKLIPVWIEVYPYGVKVWWPSIDDIPCARTIISVLNTALMVRFNLGVCFATEGGIEGRVEGEPIELRNADDTIGLLDEHCFEDNPSCQRLFQWYAEVLRLLLEEELIVDGKNFGRGTILKLLEKNPDYEEEVKIFLWLALYRKTGSKGFARAVFERLKIELSDPLRGPHIAGLTDEQVARFFVPPPLQ